MQSLQVDPTMIGAKGQHEAEMEPYENVFRCETDHCGQGGALFRSHPAPAFQASYSAWTAAQLAATVRAVTNLRGIAMRMISSAILALGLLGGCLMPSLSAFGAKDLQGFVTITPLEVEWQDIPNANGAQTVFLEGDPTKPGIYVQRVKFPPHTMTRPHWHPDARTVTVIKGTWCAGTGETFEPARANCLAPGSLMIQPAKAVHWDGARGDEEVIVQIVGFGPTGTTTVNQQAPLFGQVGK